MTLNRVRFFGLIGTAALALGSFALINAQDQDQEQQDPGDLQRAVARISLINGDVSVRRGDTGEWVAAAVNAPLMTEDRVAAGPNSRVEIQFDAGNVLRAGGNSEVRMASLEYGRYQIEVAHGTVNYSVVRPSSGNVEIDTPSLSVRPSKQGAYRIAVSESGETTVTARAGEVEVFTPRGSEWVRTGQSLMARGPASNAEFQIVNANPIDDWDRWNQERDQRLTQATSYQYVPQGVYGAEDLDTYGDWQYVDTYGWSWRPRGVAVDWAPYSLGRWAWEDWYGWTWVSYDPWGWAPYHYGRWFHEPRFGWCWYPGRIGVRHYWSPALVGFFGYGRGGGIGVGFGHVGWVPLAPHESFNRWWGRGYYHNGNQFNRNINITNINVRNVYRNAGVRNGISSVSEGDFRGGRFQRVSHVSGNEIRDAGVMRGHLPVTPTSANLRFSDRSVSRTPRSNDNVRFFSRQQPARAERVPFAQQQRNIEQGRRNLEQQGQGRSFGAGSALRAQPQQQQVVTPDVSNRGARQQSPNPSNNGRSGWRQFGEPAGQNPRNVQRDLSPGRQGNGQGNGVRGNSSVENSRPAPRQFQSESPRAVQPQSQSPSRGNANRAPWTRFGSPGAREQSDQVVRQRQEVGRQPSSEPRSFGRPSSPERSEPRSFGRPSSAEPRSSGRPSMGSPERSSPRFSAPRGGGGGGGGMSMPRSNGGGGGAPRGSGGGGGPRGNPGGGGGNRGGGGGHGRR